MDARTSTLLLVDFQARLMPAIADAEAVIANARRLAEAARLLGMPVLGTEQNPAGLGGTVEAPAGRAGRVIAKMAFDAAREPALLEAIPPDRGDVVIAGCEAHVCVLQTAFGLQRHGFRPALVQDAVGSRRSDSKWAALGRCARHGMEVVTTEMVLFEWLGDCRHPAFRDVLALVR